MLLVVRLGHFGQAVHDHEKLRANVALPQDHLARAVVHQMNRIGYTSPLVLTEMLQQRHLAHERTQHQPVLDIGVRQNGAKGNTVQGPQHAVGRGHDRGGSWLHVHQSQLAERRTRAVCQHLGAQLVARCRERNVSRRTGRLHVHIERAALCHVAILAVVALLDHNAALRDMLLTHRLHQRRPNLWLHLLEQHIHTQRGEQAGLLALCFGETGHILWLDLRRRHTFRRYGRSPAQIDTLRDRAVV